MKRESHLYEKLVSEENLRTAILEVNRGHRWCKNHQPNHTVQKVEADIDGYVVKLREVFNTGFAPGKIHTSTRWDKSAGKWRDISEPQLWPDQYVHHALVQVLEPVMMRGMDKYCCGSICGRGIKYGKTAIEHWIKTDSRGTKYCLQLDIHHFYDSLSSEVVLKRMRDLIKDCKILNIVESVLSSGVLIGCYTSQWFANTVLQPLDQLIHNSGYCSYYTRYMDNFTIFGSNKRKLKKLFEMIQGWLAEHHLTIKSDWQIFPIKSRLPSAMGFRYGKGYTLLRKRNLLRLKRQLSRLRYKQRNHKFITAAFASGLLSRLGQLRNSRNYWFYQKYRIKGVQKFLKGIIRNYQKKVILIESNKLNISSVVYV